MATHNSALELWLHNSNATSQFQIKCKATVYRCQKIAVLGQRTLIQINISYNDD